MIAIILCGGAGSRLWPVSRDLFPKPFLSPDGKRSFLQHTLLRAAGIPEIRHILIAANHNVRYHVADEVASSGVAVGCSFIIEPCGRNTAPAIAAAVLEAERQLGSETLVLVLPADHLVTDTDAFRSAVEEARRMAEKSRLVIFGIQPSRPSTAYGYIEAEGSEVVRFVEKPDEANAKAFLESGRFLWNAGIFCFKAGMLLDEFRRYAPDVLDAVAASLPDAPEGSNEAGLELSPSAFAKAPNISIDYAVVEKSDKVAMVRCDMGWSDIGSWPDLCALTPADAAGNRINDPGNVILKDAVRCNINSRDRVVAALGVEDLLIVDTPDALLVADNSRTQEVRDIYDLLKSMGHEAHRCHRTVHRPWGSFTLLERSAHFSIKKLTIRPKASVSLQLHHHRNEHWIVVSGMARVVCDDKEFFVSPNESTYIKAGCKHRVRNCGIVDLVLIEVQTGDYLGEDDIERFADEYGRAQPPLQEEKRNPE